MAELGCGLAVSSLVAALRGASVLATDWSPDAVALARLNARRNGIEIKTAVCSWADPASLVSRAPWDVVAAADVLYERRNVDLLLDLLPRLVDHRGEVLLADPGRPPAAAFFERAQSSWRIERSTDAVTPRVTVYRLTRPPSGPPSPSARGPS